HLGRVGPVDVRVQETDARALALEGDGEVHRRRGLAHAALARAHRDDVADAGHALAAEAAARLHVRGHGRACRRHSGQAPHDPFRLRLQLILHGAGGRRQLDREVDLAARDLDFLDEAEGDDVLVEVGILHGAEGGEDLFLGNAHVGSSSLARLARDQPWTARASSTAFCRRSNLSWVEPRTLRRMTPLASMTNVVGSPWLPPNASLMSSLPRSWR